ncbi:tyrosine-type recombinase/integrase [Paenibacillus sp. HWE-109]|uniref:site-specific integrase n=1 Tax=Paenibacillus sp. HWE-109 TaxID=1306526 RepID=UPI001EDDCD39|nr:site-specific integrase [Paenibacillus sp. HWE-109]UKS25062.1 tyrosine-type recombinase/integrase [Paenibacillus sp. HWE-109]
MATFRKRGTKWSYRIDLGVDPRTGKRDQPTISRNGDYPNGFFTKKEAQNAATQHQHEIDKGTYVQEKEILFSEFVPMWMKSYGHNVKKGTVRVRTHESNHLKDFFEHTKMKNITKKMYQDALNHFKDIGLSDSTVSGIHSTGRMIFSKAVELDVIKIDPTAYAKIPKAQKTVEELETEEEIPKYLEKEELNSFLKTARDQGMRGDYAIFLTLSYSGVRAGELCALKWSDIDFEEQTMSITKTYYNPTNNTKEYFLETPKTKKSKRKIELEEIVLDELKKHKAAQNEVRMAYRGTYHDKGFIFVNDHLYPGYPFYIKKIENRMSRLLKLANLNETLTPHSLRHTHTSLLAEAGVGLTEIMDRLGHKDDDTTKNVYLHVTKTKKKEASQKFGELMKNL